MWNQGCPIYDLYKENKSLIVDREQKLGARGPWVLLEHNFENETLKITKYPFLGPLTLMKTFLGRPTLTNFVL